MPEFLAFCVPGGVSLQVIALLGRVFFVFNSQKAFRLVWLSGAILLMLGAFHDADFTLLCGQGVLLFAAFTLKEGSVSL